jgi:hypothetical protein
VIVVMCEGSLTWFTRWALVLGSLSLIVAGLLSATVCLAHQLSSRRSQLRKQDEDHDPSHPHNTHPLVESSSCYDAAYNMSHSRRLGSLSSECSGLTAFSVGGPGVGDPGAGRRHTFGRTVTPLSRQVSAFYSTGSTDCTYCRIYSLVVEYTDCPKFQNETVKSCVISRFQPGLGRVRPVYVSSSCGLSDFLSNDLEV